MKPFITYGGSVPGTDHTLPGQPGWTNNQDAFAWRASDDYLVAVVSDGCGSSPYSEVGARLISRFLTEELSDSLLDSAGKGDIERYLHAGLMSTVWFVHKLARDLAERGDVRKAITNHFLATIVGIAMDRERAVVFSLGDGVYAVNGEFKRLGPFPLNEPPYLAYNLLSDVQREFTVSAVIPTADVQSLMIGSDGVADLAMLAATPMPGREELVGPLAQFWDDPKFGVNPDNVRRRLALINRERVVDNHIRKGLLPDDTTFVVVRREAEPE